MNYGKALIRALKEVAGEKLTMLDKVEEWWYDLWIYTWGLNHIRDLYYKLKYLLWYRYDLIRTTLPKTQYHDTPVLVLYGMMNMVTEFIEVEKCFEETDFNNGPKWEEAETILREVYAWWKDYPERQKEINLSLDNWHDSAFDKHSDKDFLEQLNNRKDTPESNRYSTIHEYLEEELTKEETEMLCKVVKIRSFMWT